MSSLAEILSSVGDFNQGIGKYQAILRGGNMWHRKRDPHESPQQSTEQSYAALRKKTASGGRPLCIRHGTQETTSALSERCCRRGTTGIVPTPALVQFRLFPNKPV